MERAPVIDERDSGKLLDLTRELASYYTQEWDPDADPDDAGAVVLELFSGFAGAVVDRLNRVPEKHRVSFLDALGFGRTAPQPSTLPLAFRVVDGLEGNVTIPGGTRAVADATDDRPEQTFEIAPGDGFEATPSNLVCVYSVDPRADRISDHWGQLTDGNETELFGGTNLQEHVLYVGQGDLLTLTAGAAIRVAIETTAPANLPEDALIWEYYGVESIDGEEVEGWHRAERSRHERTGNGVELRFEFPGEPIERAFPETLPEETAGQDLPEVTSRWIRCRWSVTERASDPPDAPAPSDTTPSDSADPFSVEGRSVRLRAGAVDLVPDALLSNDVPLPTGGGDEEIYPFGETPRPLDAFYVASAEAFSKNGTTVEIALAAPSERVDVGSDTGAGAPGPAPRLSWEYWNGTSWERIAALRDGSNGMREGGTVAFAVPDDLEPTTVSGRDGHWIRARIAGGEYGQVRYERTADGAWEIVTDGEPPRFDGVTIRYEEEREATHLLTYNNLAYSADFVEEGPESFEPFVGLPDRTPTLYLGFDGPLSDGPVNLLFSMIDSASPTRFSPGVRWEYCREPERDEWSELTVRDGTERLTETGIVGLVFPEETVPVDRFGWERYWIRARTIPRASGPGPESRAEGREFAFSAPASARRGATAVSSPPPEPPVGPLLIERATGTPTATPPVLRRIHLNTGWAYNVRTVSDELLGSSEGSPEQTFSVSTPPVTDETVWVDEIAALSEERRAALRETRPADVEEIRDTEGVLETFWVRWQPVADFLASDADARHYVLDRLGGTLAFGDGVSGRIPPRGRDNVRIDYRTGGGIEGNVEAGAVTALSSSIPFVDSVSNPEPGAGGADGESTEQVLDRAPKQLRDRKRAVTAADFERVARGVSGEIARAKCVPGMDEAGDHRPGWVTLLLVPNTSTKKPVPSAGLTRRVRDVLRERAPASLIASDPPQLAVRGPSYVEASVRAELVASGVESVSDLERTAAEIVDGFFHPLSGGARRTGWEFGALPSLSGLYGLLEGIDGVDHVEDLSVRFRGHGTDVTVTEGEPNPSVASDVLVCSGTHDIEAIGGT